MTKLRILMLGNSFIFVNDLPSVLAELTDAEVVHHTRGGARLAEQTGALIADVGEKFYEMSEIQDLYAEDGYHPNEAGTRLAAETITEVIKADQARKQALESEGL